MFQLISGDDIGFWIWEIDLIAPWEKLKKKILSLRVKGKICGRLLSP